MIRTAIERRSVIVHLTRLTVCCNSSEMVGGRRGGSLMIPGAVNICASYTCLQITVFDSKSQITLLCNVIPQDLIHVHDTTWHYSEKTV